MRPALALVLVLVYATSAIGQTTESGSRMSDAIARPLRCRFSRQARSSWDSATRTRAWARMRAPPRARPCASRRCF